MGRRMTVAQGEVSETGGRENGRPVSGFRGRRLAIYEHAARKGIEPTPQGVSDALGVPIRTVKRVVSEKEQISAPTIRRFIDGLDGSFDALFAPYQVPS